jgi:hypothetical protein
MKAFQAHISYKSRSYVDPNKVLHSKGRFHLNQYSATKDVDYYLRYPDTFTVISHEIKEVDVSDTLTLEGTLKECGEYEDYHVYVENQEQMTFTVADTIRDHYLGRKVRITVEVID